MVSGDQDGPKPTEEEKTIKAEIKAIDRLQAVAHTKTKPVYNHKTAFLIPLGTGSIAFINLGWAHLVTHEYDFTLKQKLHDVYSGLLYGT